MKDFDDNTIGAATWEELADWCDQHQAQCRAYHVGVYRRIAIGLRTLARGDFPEAPREPPNARFERLAAEFLEDTGFLRPGKDVPMGLASDSYERERVAAWKIWSAARQRAVDFPTGDPRPLAMQNRLAEEARGDFPEAGPRATDDEAVSAAYYAFLDEADGLLRAEQDGDTGVLEAGVRAAIHAYLRAARGASGASAPEPASTWRLYEIAEEVRRVGSLDNAVSYLRVALSTGLGVAARREEERP